MILLEHPPAEQGQPHGTVATEDPSHGQDLSQSGGGRRITIQTLLSLPIPGSSADCSESQWPNPPGSPAGLKGQGMDLGRGVGKRFNMASQLGVSEVGVKGSSLSSGGIWLSHLK